MVDWCSLWYIVAQTDHYVYNQLCPEIFQQLNQDRLDFTWKGSCTHVTSTNSETERFPFSSQRIGDDIFGFLLRSEWLQKILHTGTIVPWRSLEHTFYRARGVTRSDPTTWKSFFTLIIRFTSSFISIYDKYACTRGDNSCRRIGDYLLKQNWMRLREFCGSRHLGVGDYCELGDHGDQGLCALCGWVRMGSHRGSTGRTRVCA